MSKFVRKMCDILIENSRKMRNTIINHLEGMVIRLKRNAIQDLINWKSREDRKPMVLKGARQVGKTWLPTPHTEPCNPSQRTQSHTYAPLRIRYHSTPGRTPDS